MEKHFQYWMLLLTSSVVSLISMTKHFDDDKEGEDDTDWTTEQRWANSVAAVSVCLSVLACLMHFVAREMFVGKRFELVLVTLVLIFWCSGLPSIMDNEHSIAVTEFELILNNNIFFSSWVSLLLGLLLFASHLQNLFKNEGNILVTEWLLFAAASLVVMASSSDYFKDNNCKDLDDNDACRRSVFALILGAFSALLSFIVVFFQFPAVVSQLGSTLPTMVSQVGSILLMISWCVACAYLTFDDGPATQVGTQYFAVWSSLLFSVALASKGLMEIFDILPVRTSSVEDNDEGQDEKKDQVDKDIDVEDIDEEEVANPTTV